MKNRKEKTTQDWLPFKTILENGIIETAREYLKILKIIPINYELKTILEKEAILNAYKIFLKTCDFDIQILIRSRNENIEQHIEQMKKEMTKGENTYFQKYYEEYFQFLKQRNKDNKSSSKDFYIIIRETIHTELDEFNRIHLGTINLTEKVSKIKESLARCGNSCSEINTKEEIILLLYSFYNVRKNNLEIE